MSGSATTRDSIVDAAISLIRERGIEKTSVSEIALRANVNRKTFYKHFVDKYAVLNWFCYQEWFEYAKDAELDSGWYDVHTIAQFFEHDRKLFGTALKDDGQNSFGTYIVKVFTVIIQAVTRDAFAIYGIDEDSQRHASRDLAYAFKTECSEWLLERPEQSADEFFEAVKRSAHAFVHAINMHDNVEDHIPRTTLLSSQRTPAQKQEIIDGIKAIRF